MKYITDKPLWLSHECRTVTGEFDTEFPQGVTLGTGVRRVKSERKPVPRRTPPGDVRPSAGRVSEGSKPTDII